MQIKEHLSVLTWTEYWKGHLMAWLTEIDLDCVRGHLLVIH